MWNELNIQSLRDEDASRRYKKVILNKIFEMHRWYADVVYIKVFKIQVKLL